jgi:hypothetical protein
MVYIIGLIFTAQINLMQFLKKFKMSDYTVPWKHAYTPTSKIKLIQ